MSYQWDDIKAAIEKTEKERIIRELSLPAEDDPIGADFRRLDAGFSIVTFLCEVCYGIGVSIFCLMTIYIVIVWFLHLNLSI